MKKHIILLFILFLIGQKSFAHQDLILKYNFENITTTIKIGYDDYEEIEKVKIVGRMALKLVKERNFTKRIILVFNNNSKILRQVDYANYKFDKRYRKFNRSSFGTRYIYICQNDITLNITNTLKLIEYAINNHKILKDNLEPLILKGASNIVTLKSVKLDKLEEIISQENSESINIIIKSKWCPKKFNKNEPVHYYWENNKFHIIHNNGETIKEFQVSNILYFLSNENLTLIYDTDSSFYVKHHNKEIIIDNDVLEQISRIDKNAFRYKIKRDEVNLDRFLIEIIEYPDFLSFIVYRIKNRILNDIDNVLIQENR